MLRNLTFNSIVWILLGVLCSGAGTYFGWEFRHGISRMFPLPVGLCLTGLAMILCGYTNGFTDHSPLGRKIKKLGALLFIAGLPLLGYGLWEYI